MRGAGRPDRRHSDRVLANSSQSETERRVDQSPRHQEEDEQNHERIGVGGGAVEIELEDAEELPHAHALQTIGAAGQPARAVGRLGEQQAKAERDHDQREVAKARDDETRDISEQAGSRGGDHQTGQRLAPAPFRNQARGVGGKAEIGGMAERHDAGITENEIERQREQRRDGDLARQHEVVGSEHERKQRCEPERNFHRPPADLGLEIALRFGDRGRRHHLASPEQADRPPHQ